MYNNKLVFRS